MIVDEIIYDIIEAIRGSTIVDDEAIDFRKVLHWINNKRAVFIRRSIAKYNYYDDNLLQTVELQLESIDRSNGSGYRTQVSGSLRPGKEYTILDLGKGDLADFTPAGAIYNRVGDTFIAYPNFSVNSDILTNPIEWGDGGKLSYYKAITAQKQILRSVNKLPKPIELRTKPAVFAAESNDILSKDFSFVPFEQLKYSGSNRFNKRNIFCSIREDYIYVKYGHLAEAYGNIDSIVIRGIFQDPTTIPNFNIDTDNYPINRNFYDFIKSEVINIDLQTILKTSSDDVNDGNGNINN